MAAITNTLLTDTMTDILEDLDRVIRNIDPTEVPFYSNAMKGTATNAAAHEWLTDNYRTPRNAPQNEGEDASFDALTPRTRLVNSCQIADDNGIVSGTSDAVDQAPSQKEIIYQTIKKGREVRRDVEVISLANVIKANTDPRAMASMATWFTNASVGATGVLPTGDGTGAVTEGTARALTVALVDTGMQTAYVAGGQPSMLMMDAPAKVKWSKLNFAGGGTDVANLEANRTEPKPMASVGAVNKYITDFGDLDVVPNRFMDPANITGLSDQFVYLLDSRWYGIDTLPGRSFKVKPLAPTGDAEKFLVLWEGTVKVHNQGAHFGIFAIDSTL